MFFFGRFKQVHVIESDTQGLHTFTMATRPQKRLRITSTNGDEKVVSVMDTTTVREISQQFHEDDGRDREANFLRGATLLEPDMTVNEAGLEDGGVISLVWSDPFIEMVRWTGEEMDQDLYVRIPPETTSIEPGAFSNCKALVKIVIPNSVTSIGDRAFYGCRSLTEVKIPNSVTRLGSRAFTYCSSLTKLDIPDSATRIEDGAFYGCSSLTQVEIPNSVTSIGHSAFTGCKSLTHVKINNSETKIGPRAFAGCTSLIKPVQG